MRYFLLPLVFALILSTLVFAQAVDKVIIATDITSVDLLVAKAAGDKEGIPALVAENGLLNDDIKSQLASLNAKTVIIVGGPVVIKPAVADELQSLGYNVIRLWGLERTGTAIEVAKYFWPEGADCSILADDTKNSDVDTELQVPASSLASESGCPLIPVPQGTMPAEVLALLENMNVSLVKIVGRVAPDTAQLAKFRLKVIAGDKKKVESDVESEIEAEATKEGKKLKLVIVATPSWKHGLGIGAYPSERSVVRFVSNVSQVPELVTKIKEKNITDVRVVGIPALAQEIASLLNQSGITAKVVSAEKAIQVERKILDELKEKWVEKKRVSDERRSTQLARIKQKLLERINGAEELLNEHEIELQSLKEDGAPEAKIAEIQSKIDAAKLKIVGLKTDILSNSVDYTNRELAKLLESVRSKRWEMRDDIKLKINISGEEGGFETMEKMTGVGELENKSAALRAKCNNTQALEDLIARAKSIREEAKKAASSGEHGKAAELVVQAKRVSDAATNIGNVCEKAGKISDKLRSVAEKRAEKAKTMEERISRKAWKTGSGK